MGLLDDAIREHLDLKRRRGADPAEVERLEREALGPVHRGQDFAESPQVGDHAFTEADALGVPATPEPAYPEADRYHVDSGHEESFADEDDPPALDLKPVRFGPRSLRERLTRRSAAPAEEGYLEEDDEFADDPFAHEAEDEHAHHEAPPRPEAAQWSAAAQQPDVASRPPRAANPPLPPLPPAVPPAPADIGHSADVFDHADQHTVEYSAFAHEGEEGEDMLEETPDFLQDTPDHDRLWFEQRPPKDFDFNE